MRIGRSALIVIGCLYTLGCGRGSRAHASSRDAGGEGAMGVTAAEPSNAEGGHAPDTMTKVACTPDAQFPGVFDVPEGSAAAEVELRAGVRELLVVSDSGHKGAAIARVIPSGPVRALTLPLDAK